MRIALAGSGLLAHSLLKALLESGHQVVALVQDGRKAQGRRRQLAALMERVFFPAQSVLGLAKGRRIPVIHITRMTDEELAPLRAVAPDLLLVGGFSIILKKPILTLPRLGCVNAHSSLLPRHRGPNPFTAAVLAGDAESGVTFHVIDEGIDTGDILIQYPFPIGPQDTAGDVHRRSCAIAGAHVAEVMDRIEREGLRGIPQDPARACYDKKVTPDQAFIRWEEPARDIERKVRALMPFIMARFLHRGQTVYLCRAAADSAPEAAAHGTILVGKPRTRIATGRGSLTVHSAFTRNGIPWIWPPLFSPPRPGEKVE